MREGDNGIASFEIRTKSLSSSRGEWTNAIRLCEKSVDGC